MVAIEDVKPALETNIEKLEDEFQSLLGYVRVWAGQCMWQFAM
jgi:hypothetical protein